jgi:hypothetical protein
LVEETEPSDDLVLAFLGVLAVFPGDVFTSGRGGLLRRSTDSTSALREEKAREISSSRSRVMPWEDRKTASAKAGLRRVGRIFFFQGSLVGKNGHLNGG